MMKNDKTGKNLFKGNLLKNLIQEMQEIEKIRVETKFNLANNIEALLKNKGISKSEFAALMGKSPSEISKWLSGKHNFTIDTLMEIAHALRTDLTELLKFKPEPLFKTEVKVERRKPKTEEKASETETFDDFELLE
jgi:transcriptional regulator with XRE-family HTH domain